jgi:zinc and cadmium transporter
MLAILPEALDHLSPERVFGTLLGGILIFFVLEKLVLWRHCHIHDCEVHDGSVFPVLIGDAFHNFVDGAVIAAAVMTSVPLGVSTALAVAAHEIPQEVGDFAILLHAGYSRRRALLLNVTSGLASAVGALVALFALKLVPVVLPYCLALAAASFLYVAMADLIPGLHRGRTDAHSLRQILLIAGRCGDRVRLRPISAGSASVGGDDRPELFLEKPPDSSASRVAKPLPKAHWRSGAPHGKLSTGTHDRCSLAGLRHTRLIAATAPTSTSVLPETP